MSKAAIGTTLSTSRAKRAHKMSVVNLADTASLLAEVTNVFHTDEDMGTAQKVLDTRAAIEKTCAEKQEEIKQIIRGVLHTPPHILAACAPCLARAVPGLVLSGTSCACCRILANSARA
eukprot:SAG11_NODE_940_length_6465_cov_16.053566_5_plen_119_part_00